MKWLIVLGVLAMVGFGGYAVKVNMQKKQVPINIGKAILRAEVANTDALRQRGLSGRSELGKDEAMLFVFDSDSNAPIWMKDMKIPIDIIWLDAKKKVVHVQHNVVPDAEPHETYRSPVPARYVLELSAGGAKQNGIKIGVAARFDDGAVR